MVWWFTRKMAQPVKGHHFQRYKHITRLFPYYFPIISLVVPYDFPMISLFFPYCSLLFLLFTYYFPLSSLFLPYYFPMYIYIYKISLFYPIIVPYASQVSKTINLDT